MKKFINKHIVLIHYIFLIIIGLIMVWYIARDNYVLSVNGDFFEQNIAFRHYFRELFYDTKNLFPNLALHIGGGQNIYYFVYYGLFSPFTILSYFFPFISAGAFLMILGILNITLTPILFYNFLKKNNYSDSLCFVGALFLLSSDSFIGQNFRHVMFIHYIPFLIMGLFGTKKYLDENKSFLLILSVFLIIITSYYYSIPSIICLCLYALYYDMKKAKKFKTLIKDACKFLGVILLGIIASAFLLLPVIYTLKDGRGSMLYTVTINDFLPNLNLHNLTRSQYGVGLTLITLFSAIYNILFMKKENKALAIILLILTSIPIFAIMLNGFLYNSGKVFIPLIPVFIITILDMLTDLTSSKKRRVLLTLVITLPLALLSKGVATDKIIFDLFLTFVVCLIYSKYSKTLVVVPIIVLSFNHIFLNYNDRYFMLTKEEYDKRYQTINADMNMYINNNIDSLYRYQNNYLKFANITNGTTQYLPTVYSSTQNRDYQDNFYKLFNNHHKYNNSLELFHRNNLFFQKFMGVRYYLSKYEPTYGYKKIAEFNGETLYENDNVYSIGFATSNILNYSTYYSLPYMAKPQAFINNVIVDGASSNPNLEFNYQKIDLKYEVKEAQGISYDSYNELINTEDDAKVVLKLQEPIKNKLLAIRFKTDNYSKNNIYLKINNVVNSTSKKGYATFNKDNIFEYFLSGNEDIDELVIYFERACFKISDVEFYTIDNEFFDQNNTTPLNIDFEKTKGDVIKGDINVLNDGYFIFTIPYDKGYTIKVDNKKVNIEKVNEGFIGFKIDKGYHEIELTYRAPLSRLGQIISIFSIGGVGIILFLENKHNKRILKK